MPRRSWAATDRSIGSAYRSLTSPACFAKLLGDERHGSLYEAAVLGQTSDASAWALQLELMKFLETAWKEPDEGIWEVRGPRRHFTHSKVMAWVAVDRAVRMVEEFGYEGPVDSWRELRDRIHEQVCARGYSRKARAFTQYYGSEELDASLLMMPLVGLLPATDERVRSTIEAIERDLTEDGLVRRYRDGAHLVDGLDGREGAFLACSFWMADCLDRIGRRDDAHRLFERLLQLRSDLGLLAEEYDARTGRQAGNFPQAFSRVALVNAALNLTGDRRNAGGPVDETPTVSEAIFASCRRGIGWPL